ncbi:MAG TPA: OsmC family protein [Burkholderiaceae bacterium]|nr:OsmC family protein [Burkholderiaceae bacterium]
MSTQHVFEGALHWSGGSGTDERGRLRLARDFVLRFKDKTPIDGSSPAVYRGDDSRHNPETLMVASLMACHHLTYLAVCERANIRVLEYTDSATGTLALRDGKMRMVEVVLWPQVRISDSAQLEQARELHAKAHTNCFMSNSVSFEIKVQPTVTA